MNYKEEIIKLLDEIDNENDLGNIYQTVSLSTQLQRKKYNEWFNNQSDEIFNLHIKTLMLESYFDDMMLDKNSIMYKYMRMLNDEFADDTNNDTDALSLQAYNYRFEISADIQDERDGYSNKSDRVITIKKSSVQNENVILHEMLHGHEQILLSINHIVRETLLVELYNKLKKEIPNIDKIISIHANINHNLELSKIGGEHDLLFLLKSLEIDLRRNNKLFTVFGYGYNEYFTELNII